MRNLTLCHSLLVAIALILQSGCTKSSPEAELSGKVTFHKRPLGLGTLNLITADGQKGATTMIEQDGTYSFDSAPLGKVKLSIVLPHNATASLPANVKIPGMPTQEVAHSVRHIPQKYFDPETSGLTYDIKQGQNKFDIHLQYQR